MKRKKIIYIVILLLAFLVMSYFAYNWITTGYSTAALLEIISMLLLIIAMGTSLHRLKKGKT